MQAVNKQYFHVNWIELENSCLFVNESQMPNIKVDYYVSVCEMWKSFEIDAQKQQQQKPL